MPNNQQLLVRVRIQLVAVNGVNDLWADLSRFIPTIGVTKIRGRIVLCEKVGNFRVRPGIQTYGTDAEVPDAPLAPTTGTGLGYVANPSKVFVDWDPTAAGNGVVATKRGLRVGLLYSSTDATVSRGDVILELYVDA